MSATHFRTGDNRYPGVNRVTQSDAFDFEGEEHGGAATAGVFTHVAEK